MNSAFECGVCIHAYDEAERKPLMLLCGHNYCQQCLQSLVSAGSPACPSCRKEIEAQVTELPVNLALLSSSNSSVTASEGSAELCCSVHKYELDYWCVQCKVSICKQCLVEAHSKHDLTLTEEIFNNEGMLADLKDKIRVKLQQAEASIQALQKVETLGGIIDQLKCSVPQLKASFQKQYSTLQGLLDKFGENSSEPSEHKRNVLKMLKFQNETSLEEVSGMKVLKQFQDQVTVCQAGTSHDYRTSMIIEYMPDGCPWVIISNELAEKALHTLKKTDHQTPRATVISTNESPILCLPELLQYLAASSTTMELQIMDTNEKNQPYKNDWLPLKKGGSESTNFNHCYRLKALAPTLMYFQTLVAALTTVGSVVNNSEEKVLALVHPDTRTYDICVLSFRKIVKSIDGSWPLPLEIHVIGLTTAEHSEWVKDLLPTLYYTAQPRMGNCRVYLPQYDGVYHCYPGVLREDTQTLFAMFVELGQKFSTQHRVFLPYGSYSRLYSSLAETHKLSVEFKTYSKKGVIIGLLRALYTSKWTCGN